MFADDFEHGWGQLLLLAARVTLPLVACNLTIAITLTWLHRARLRVLMLTNCQYVPPLSHALKVVRVLRNPFNQIASNFLRAWWYTPVSMIHPASTRR